MRTKKVLLAVLLASLTACAGKRPATPPEEPAVPAAGGPVVITPQTKSHETYPFVGTAKVSRYILDNGLRLLVVENHSSPTFAYQTWFRVGSRDELTGHTGLAHLFEHMMFKQTKTLADGEFDKILESSGAEGENAFTDRDYTAYVQELPADKLELIVKLEAERMVNLVVDEKAFKTETEVVQNERRYRNENSPAGIMYQDLFELAFTKSAYHWPVIGYTEDLERMTGEDARKFYKAWYSPNHATIVAVGDIDPEKTRALVQKHYGDLPGQASPPTESVVEPPQESPRRKQRSLNIQVEKVMMGYHVPGAASDDTPALDLLQAVLTGGNSSRLHRALVETGIASSAEAYDIEDKEPSLFIVSASLQKGKKAAQAESVILRELARVASEPIPDSELERAKNRADFEFFDGLGNDMAMAQFLGHFESIAGDFRIGLNQHSRVRGLTAADLQSVAKKYLEPSNRTVITGVTK